MKNGNFLIWSGLNNPKILKHLQSIIATALGNLDQDQKNLQLTKPDIKIFTLVKSKFNIVEDKHFYPITNSVKTHKVCAKIVPFNTKRKVPVALQDNPLTNQSPEHIYKDRIWFKQEYDNILNNKKQASSDYPWLIYKNVKDNTINKKWS